MIDTAAEAGPSFFCEIIIPLKSFLKKKKALAIEFKAKLH